MYQWQGRRSIALVRRAAVVVVAVAVALSAQVSSTPSSAQNSRTAKTELPVTGDVVWSVPTLVTLNPIGAPIAHIGLHVSAVLHSYDTNTYLPPHSEATSSPR